MRRMHQSGHIGNTGVIDGMVELSLAPVGFDLKPATVHSDLAQCQAWWGWVTARNLRVSLTVGDFGPTSLLGTVSCSWTSSYSKPQKDDTIKSYDIHTDIHTQIYICIVTNIIVFSFLVGGYHSKNLASDGPKWVAHVIPRFQEQLCVFAKNHGHRLQYAAARTAWLRATRAATAQTTRVPAVKRWSAVLF